MTELTEIISYGHIENKMMYPHKNPGMELVLVEQGRLDWAVEGVPEALKPGTLFFTLPWQTHGSMHIREPKNRIYFILFDLPGAGFQPLEKITMAERFGFSEEELNFLSTALVNARRHAWPASQLARHNLPEIIHRLDNRNPIDHTIAFSMLRTILLELAAIITRDFEISSNTSRTMHRIEQFLKSLRKTLDHSWTLNEMAESCGVKRTYFSNITLRLTGYAPLQYLNRLRFEHACRLLRETDRSITDIGFECGYSTSQYFAETFKNAARMTPSEYRKSLPELERILQANWKHPELRTMDDERKRRRIFS
ncbi:AraC family transcriptional regulator [Pontiella agarivorans]|uniref:AraC family transcriptional regulator n=1 Tax=Pontiella agarivorans TaxID=3038953 RepID=A0ABU5N289_9BACT|nr:AraC family transcriptional regulator [Pontiella agarivorans]MDZ8120545.1 AraC family transcriptional regulator [Pontiella agarivorans]